MTATVTLPARWLLTITRPDGRTQTISTRYPEQVVIDYAMRHLRCYLDDQDVDVAIEMLTEAGYTITEEQTDRIP